MTDYFEVCERDGAARIGELRLTDPVVTPALADPFLVDAGSLWTAERTAPSGDEAALTVLPHRAFPAGTREAVREAFQADPPAIDAPTAAVVDSESPQPVGADAYVLADTAGFIGHGEAFRDAICGVKAALPADTALGLFGVATPANVATRAAFGVDLVDATRARTKGTEGKYLTADAEHFLERTPVFRSAEITAATKETLDRVEIRRFADRVTTRYRNRFTEQPLVVVPCAATKPYSDSQSHRQFHDAIQWRGHTVSMTSPIGVVPQELETTYPAQHYDAVVTGDWSDDEIAFVTEVLRRYLQRTDYERVIAHVPAGGYREICERVEADPAVDVDFEYTCVDHPTTDASLAALDAALDGEPAYSKREREHNTVRAIADYLIGDGAGDALFQDMITTGRYPKLQAWTKTADGREQLATMVPQYGTLSFTLAGARRWLDCDAPTRRVEIDGFVPHGSVLAPGVVDADADIRVGDEVVIEGPKAFAVGRAAMTGPEMCESTRGVASTVRHVTER